MAVLDQKRLDDLALRYQSYNRWMDYARKIGGVKGQEVVRAANEAYERDKMFEEIYKVQQAVREKGSPMSPKRFLSLLLVHKPNQQMGFVAELIIGSVLITVIMLNLTLRGYVNTIAEANAEVIRKTGEPMEIPSLTKAAVGFDISDFILPGVLVLGGLYLIKKGKKK